MQYVMTVNEALNLLIEREDTFTAKRPNRRRIDDRKDDRKTHSCFRKGYHKYERDWKVSSRRNARHNSRAELRKALEG